MLTHADDVFDVGAVRSALDLRLRSLESELHQVRLPEIALNSFECGRWSSAREHCGRARPVKHYIPTMLALNPPVAMMMKLSQWSSGRCSDTRAGSDQGLLACSDKQPCRSAQPMSQHMLHLWGHYAAMARWISLDGAIARTNVLPSQLEISGSASPHS